jgi:hypothetical protein
MHILLYFRKLSLWGNMEIVFFKMWRSMFWSKSTYVAEELISTFVMAEYLDDRRSFFAES